MKHTDHPSIFKFAPLASLDTLDIFYYNNTPPVAIKNLWTEEEAHSFVFSMTLDYQKERLEFSSMQKTQKLNISVCIDLIHYDDHLSSKLDAYHLRAITSN
jgi:hypothetical protein